MQRWSEDNPTRVRLERHKIARLRKNEARSVSIGMLNSLCEYLIEVCHVPATELPQELFGATEDHLLDLLSSTRKLQFYLGVRSSSEWGPNTYVMAADASLQSRLTGMISHYLVTRQAAPLETAETVLVKAPPRDQAQTRGSWKQTQHSAAATFRQSAQAKDVTLAVSGSTKVNCLVEHVLASIFGVDPYRPPKRVRQAKSRKVPIFFRYRDDDPQPASCCGGLSLSSELDQANTRAGIYFEKQDGSWDCLPCDDKHEDVAFATYVHHPKAKRQVWVACGGFSSLATRLFSSVLDDLVRGFWPPQIKTSRLVVGLFLVRFKLKTPTGRKTPRQSRDLGDLKNYEIIRLDDDVMTRRLRE